MKYNYTDDQRNAITTDQSCVLVLGSAGTGKTHVLVERMNYLVGTLGVKQGQILLITSSYNELYNIESKMDEIIDGSSICMYTVQMLALKVILDHEGYDKVFLDSDSLKALKDKITRSSFETEKQYNEYLSMPRVYPNQTSKINEMYNQYIKTHNIMHQTDYIDYAIKLIESNDAIKVKYVNLYSHVFIDNAQDYDGLQSKLIALLTNNTQSFFILGNDDQLLKPVDIETTYLYEVYKQDNFKQIILKDNYKTAKSIIKLATLIKANKPRLNPDINYMIDDPYRPKYMLCHNGVEIQKQMITEIKQLLNTEDDLKLSDICIITSKEHKDLWINYLKQFDYTMDEIKMDVHIDEGIFNALAKHILEPIDKDNLFTFMLDFIKQIDITKIAENQMIELTSIYLGVSKTVNIENFILFLHLKVYQHIQY